jgi:putative transposase
MKVVCATLDKGKSWYYETLASFERVKKYEQNIMAAVKQIRIEHPAYGTRKIWRQLLRVGIKIGRDKLHKLLQKHGMILSKRYKNVRTSIPGMYDFAMENMLKDLAVVHANQVWCTDITYIFTAEGILYLSAIMDVYSRKIIGYNISHNLRTDGSLDCLEKALKNVTDARGIIHHSDHGTQYCSYRYLNKLKSHGMEVSFTGKNHCYDNAKIERFFNTLKYEYGLRGVVCSKKLAIELIHNAIYDYNNNRLHAGINYLIPCELYNAA